MATVITKPPGLRGSVSRVARNAHADRGSGAVLGLVPLRRQRDQLPVGIARGDVGEHDGGQGARVMQLLAAALDAAFVGEFAQHALERGAIGVLQAERARDLAGADLAGLLADEGEEVVFGGKGRFGMGRCHENKIRERNSLMREDMGPSGSFRHSVAAVGWAKSLAQE